MPTSSKRYPVLLAVRDGDLFRAWCPFCRCYHTHGAAEGHRVAHCASNTPFSDAGYILKEDKASKRRGSKGATS
jgi:hypothetical protein